MFIHTHTRTHSNGLDVIFGLFFFELSVIWLAAKGASTTGVAVTVSLTPC